MPGTITERSGHVPHRTFSFVLNNGGHLSRLEPAIALVDVLDHFLPPAGFKIDIDIGFFITESGQKTLKRKAVINRIHRGDVQQETHRGIRGRTPPLTQDAPGPRETHNVVDD